LNSVRVIICFLLVLVGSPALANDTFVYDNGSTVYSMQTDDVRMVAEKITVTMESLRFVSVVCDYTFENVSDKDVTARVGFPATPFFAGGEEMEPPLENFITFVDGRELPVDVKVGEDGGDVMYWYTWDVTFPAKQTIRLRNEYDTTSSMSYYYYWFEYILTTGANWRGAIGEAVIEVSYSNPEEPGENVVYICPEGYKVEGNIIVWKLKDLTPRENVFIFEKGSDYLAVLKDAFMDRFTDKYDGDKRVYSDKDLLIDVDNKSSRSFLHVSNPCLEKAFRHDIQKQYARLLRNEIFARHGRSFDTMEIERFFKSTGWYNPDPDFSAEMLNDTEKRNVQFIFEYEKKMGWR
jgi:hypothetical protein